MFSLTYIILHRWISFCYTALTSKVDLDNFSFTYYSIHSRQKRPQINFSGQKFGVENK